MVSKTSIRTLLLAGSISIFVAGCGSSPASTSTPSFAAGSPEARGAALFSGKGRCSTCHSLSANTVIVGPSLAGVATRAGTREPPLSAADYLEESILQPDKFKAPGFENAQMDSTLAKILTTDEVSDLVAFLLTLK